MSTLAEQLTATWALLTRHSLRYFGVIPRCMEELEGLYIKGFLQRPSLPWSHLREPITLYTDFNDAGKLLYPQQRDKSLAALIKIHKDSLCSDRRDKVFALRALACDSHRITVDYTIPIEALLVDVLAASPDGFCLCTIVDLLEALYDTPSDRLYGTSTTGARRMRFASLSYAPRLLWYISVANHGKSLLLDGSGPIPATRSILGGAVHAAKASFFDGLSIDLSSICKNLRTAWTFMPDGEGGTNVYKYMSDQKQKLGHVKDIACSTDGKVTVREITVSLDLAAICETAQPRHPFPPIECSVHNTSLKLPYRSRWS